MEISGAVALVSGGASGLGAATARRLAGGGAIVVIADLERSQGAQLAADIGGRFVATDVTQTDTVESAVRTATGLGEMRVLVCCAGVGPPARVVGRDGAPMPLEHFVRTLQVNLVGTFDCIRQAAAAMVANAPDAEGERGVIVCTSSIAAFDGQIGQSAYAASKGGIVGMTLPLARDLGRGGVRVVTIAPGIFDTPLLGELPENVREGLGAVGPFPPRLGRPDEFAALALHIIENPMLNGEVIRLDGAMRMPAR
jgi:NAD(P)-dependent dehydrogenase (short-subunit alcohol dehydrogenase family)